MNVFANQFHSPVSDNTMFEVKACRSCLETDIKLYSLYEKQLAHVLVELTGIAVTKSDGLPILVCGVCLHYIMKFKKFKENCHKSLQHLHRLQVAKQLTTNNIKCIDRRDLGTNLQTTLPEVNSYVPPEKQLGTSTFHIHLEESGAKVETLLEAQPYDNTENMFINYVDCSAQCNVEIKKEYTECSSINNFNVNVKIVNLNDEELNNVEDDGFTNNDDDHIEDDSKINVFEQEYDTEIKQETTDDVIKTKKVAKKRNIDKNNSTTNSKKDKFLKEEKGEKVRKKVNRNKNVKHKKVKMKEDSPPATPEEPADPETEQARKNALLFYNSHPSRKISQAEMKKRLDMLEKFSKAYNVEIRFLSADEQRAELEQRRRYYKELPYTCALCYRGYSIPDAYDAHMAVHDPSSGPFECGVCRVRCRSARDREKHVNAAHLKRFRCKQCGCVTKSQSYAKAHFARHAGASYACEQCGKRFTQQSNYLSHCRSAHAARARRCPLCYDAFLGALGLNVHMGIVHKQAVRCGSCGAHFETPRALAAHNEAACHADHADRCCPVCGLGLASEKLLKKHYDELHRLQLKCEQCGKSFATKFKLSTHMQEHRRADTAVDSGYICESCGKGNFKNLNQLRSHQRVHTGERPYKCGLCAKTFRINNLLKSHMRVHTDERRYACPLCPKAFHQSAHRTAHLLTHTKERPYACAACPKRYTSASAAREHADTAHRGLPARPRRRHHHQHQHQHQPAP